MYLQEGAFAFIFKSAHFPDEMVATRRGSPLLVGVKTEKKLKVDFVDVEFGSGKIVISFYTSMPFCIAHFHYLP
jgi:glucosamine 6-phosphate synthetase-like amidotransferase/phosphosugar isomerase protein